MKAMIVFAHEGEQSFNHEILNRVKATCEKAGVPYQVRDLYKMKFNPVFDASDMRNVENQQVSADVEEEQELLTEADLLVMIYPVWWWSPPAILKGYLDRVFTLNFAFRYKANGLQGLLTGKRAIVLTTTRASDKERRSEGFGQVVEKQIADGTLAFMGYEVTYKNFDEVPYVSDSERQQMLVDVETLMSSHLRVPVGV